MKPASKALRIVVLAPPVAVLGGRPVAGMALMLRTLHQVCLAQGFTLDVVAPEGSSLPGIHVYEVPGHLQPKALAQESQDCVQIPVDSVLANMCRRLQQLQKHYDLVLNLSYDWLPFYLTPFLSLPVAHLISLSAQTSHMTKVVLQTAEAYPGTVGFLSRSLVQSYQSISNCPILGMGLDSSKYEFSPKGEDWLAWLGRIMPGKGLEDAIAVSAMTRTPLRIFGLIEDEAYWRELCRHYTGAPISYQGSFPTEQLQAYLKHAKGLLMTSAKAEAFGMVVLEALACGVPVIAYNDSSAAEMVVDGKTGWIVENNVAALVSSLLLVGSIDRQTCRHHVQEVYSLEAFGQRVAAWFSQVLSPSPIGALGAMTDLPFNDLWPSSSPDSKSA